MWSCLVEGKSVLIECPSRWYLGVVKERTPITVIIEEGLVGHLISDLGLFLDGQVPDGTELTPLPRDLEINFGSIDTVQEYPVELLRKVRKRTHTPAGEET